MIKNIFLNDSVMLSHLQGKISDPIICNELGFKIIYGTESPNFGLSIDYNPLFLKRVVSQIGYRSDFKDNQIFYASVESKYLFNTHLKKIDFKIVYENFGLKNSILTNFQKLSAGPIYGIPWTSFGCFIGQDSFEKEIGVDLYFKYHFHRLIAGTENEYKSKMTFQSLIGYWNKNMSYDFNTDYLITYNFSCGLGYKKLYDFEEIYFSLRYLFCY